MKILVTGGAGFIGSHISRHFFEAGHEVFVIDNESTGNRENLPSGVHFYKGDVGVTADVGSVFANGLEAVLHIAGQVSLIRSFTDPVVDLRTNVEGTLNVLQCCVRHRVPRLLHASSMITYGHAKLLPTPETAPCEPVSYYGITKYAGERYVRTTAERVDLDFDFHTTCFRMYNVYGPGQALDNPYQGVLGIFLGNIQRREPITIFGDGDQSRDFVYIDDIVAAWDAALNNPRSYGEVFNLGSGKRLSIKQVADEALAAYGFSRETYPILHAPARSGEQRDVEADVTRIRTMLGWEPRTSFEKGLRETVKWARQQAEPLAAPEASSKTLNTGFGGANSKR
jgi:UDP-glucose 4-epimerase